jgi:hypothetical protein
MLCYGFLVTQVPDCSAKVSSLLEPLLHLVDQIMFCAFPHTTEQDSQPITSLISKQVVPYRTRNPTVSTISTHAQNTTSNLTTVTSHHDR